MQRPGWHLPSTRADAAVQDLAVLLAGRELTADKACPSCREGRLARRQDEAGSVFYGCSNYPKMCKEFRYGLKAAGEKCGLGCSSWPLCDYTRDAPR